MPEFSCQTCSDYQNSRQTVDKKAQALLLIGVKKRIQSEELEWSIFICIQKSKCHWFEVVRSLRGQL